MKTYRKSAFTIIELLTVIAVIAILSGILIPAANGVIRQSRISASKAQLWQYVTAIENFKAEYNYYPTIFNGENSYSLEGAGDSRNFIESLSARDTGNGSVVSVGGNYRSIQFYNFPDSECFDDNGTIRRHRLADRFNNTSISLMVDGNGDGLITPNPPNGRDPGNPSTPDGALRTSVTAWVVEKPDGSEPGYALWE